MKTEVSPMHLTEALARAHQHWEARRGEGWVPETAVPTAYSIAISREAGSYGAAIAHAVGDRLGWPVYDGELLRHIADDLGVRRNLLESLDEKQVSWLSDCMSGLFTDSAVNESAYFRRLVELLLSLASHGHCVVVGRGASFIMPLASTLRVRVVAPLAVRANAVQREHGVTLKEATARVETTDRERNRFVVDHLRIDPTNPANYDLTLNVSRFSIDECADLVLAALDRLRRHAISSRSTRRRRQPPAFDRQALNSIGGNSAGGGTCVGRHFERCGELQEIASAVEPIM